MTGRPRMITRAMVVALILPVLGVGASRAAAAPARLAGAGANGRAGAAHSGTDDPTGRSGEAGPLTPGHALDLPGGTAGLAPDVSGFAIGPRGERAFVSLAGTDEPASVQIVDLTADPARVIGAITGVPAGPLAVGPGGRLLYVLGGLGADTTLSVADLTATPPALRESTQLGDAYSSLVLAPDGRVAYLGEDLGFDHSVRALDTSTWKPTGFAADTSLDVRQLALSPDGGTMLAIGGWDDRAIAIDTRTAAVITLRGTTDDHVTAIAFSADGRRALLAVRSDVGPRVVALDPHDGTVLARSPILDMASVSDIAVSPDGRFVYVGGAVEPLVSVLAVGTLSVMQRVTLPIDSGSSLMVATRGPRYGTVYAVQGGDIASADGHPVVTPLDQRDPGPALRSGEPGGGSMGPLEGTPLVSGSGGPWTAVIVAVGIVVLLGLIGTVILLVARSRSR